MNRRIRNINFIPFLFIAVYFFSQSESKAQDQKMYLGYNLWFDNPREILSLNNKEGKYLPAGLEVDQVRHGRNKISFRAVKLDQKFLVIFYPKYHRGVRFEDFKNEFNL